MSLVEVASFADRTIAELARRMLAAEGIDAVLFDGGLASLGLGILTPARLMVEAPDEAQARRLLATPA